MNTGSGNAIWSIHHSDNIQHSYKDQPEGKKKLPDNECIHYNYL